MFSPAQGRFLSMDPLGVGLDDPNGYRYVGNNPVNGVDPNGLQPPQRPPVQAPWLPGYQPQPPGLIWETPNIPYTPGGGQGGMGNPQWYNPRPPALPTRKQFKLCQRNIHPNDIIEVCIYGCAGPFGIQHVYIGYDGQGWGIGAVGPGKPPDEEKQFHPDTCTVCRRVNTPLQHGGPA